MRISTINMADSNEGGINKLEEQLTCALCLDLYIEPVILPCHHVFCNACIQPVVEEAKTGSVSCPKCRGEFDGAGSMQTAFMINTLKDAYEKLKKERRFVSRGRSLSFMSSLASDLPDFFAKALPEPADDDIDVCGRHRSQSLDLYCRDCNVLMCRDCVLADKEHADHKYTYVNTLAVDCRTTLEQKITAMKELGGRLREAGERVSQVKSQVDQQEADITKKTTEAFETLFQVLEEEKEHALAQLSLVMDQKRIILNAQAQTLQMTSREVAHETEQLATAVTTSSNEQIVKSRLITEEKIDAHIETLELLSVDPLETANVGGITAISPDAIRKVCRSASLYYMACASKTQLVGDGIRSALTNQSAHFGVKLHDIYGDACVMPQDLVAQLKSLRNGLVTNADVTVDSEHSSRYLVTYTVETSGRYELNILVNGKHVPQSPLSLRIRKPPHQIWVRCVEISTLNKPTGLAIIGEMLYVSEFGADRVSIFNSKLEKIRSIENLAGPSEITVDPESNVYVCTTTDHKLHKISPDDKLLVSVGGKGKEASEFNFPNGNCFHKQKLYVCDSENYRIKEYDSDLNLLCTHDKKVMGPKKYDFPCDIAVDSQGLIYLVDGNNHKINVFNENWKFQHTIGKKGNGPGELQNPVCIHIDDYDQIFVTEYENHRISVFSTSGQFLATFGERYLNHPEGLTVDQDGFVYVSHSRKNVLVFC